MSDLLNTDVLRAFDRQQFEREGYWVWQGILTAEGRQRWTESLQRLQQMNDTIVQRTDWAAIDYEPRGLIAPEAATITPEALASYCGGSEQMRFQTPGLRDFMYEQGLFDPAIDSGDHPWHGMMPEYFPLAYDDFMLDIGTTHPQMRQLFTMLLGERYLLDHVLMLNRMPGSKGRRWHGHPYRQGQHETEDPRTGGAQPQREYLSRQCVRTLCYPEGMGPDDGGGELSVVPGAHLYRTPYVWNTPRTEYDDDFANGWLQGKVHAFTGEPLRIRTLSLPPGSMVSFGHHMPHAVAHRDDDAPTRWGLLMAYRTPDESAEPTRWQEGAPVHWVERMEAAGTLRAQMRAVFEGDRPA